MDETVGGSQPGSAAQAQRGRRGLLIAPLLVFAVLVLMFGFALQQGDPSRLPSALIGKPAPAIDLRPVSELVAANGQPLPGFDHRELAQGRVSVVNFWSSWCVPCVEEHPLLVRLAQRTGAPIYGINYKDQDANARRFLGRYGNPFKAVGADADGRAAIEWGVYGMPETFVVDGKGTIVYKQVGPLSPDALETKLIPAIDAARRGGG